jgi:hypothetical protein
MASTPSGSSPFPTPTPSQAKKNVDPNKLVRGRRRPGEVIVVSHSDLFYWWPVWLIGFIMSALTYIHGVHAGFIKGHPEVVEITHGEIKESDGKRSDVQNRPAIISSPKIEDPFPTTNRDGEDQHAWPLMHNSKNLGAIFCVTLLLVIVITNVHLRGLWSLIVIIIIVLGSIIFALGHIWEKILAHWSHLAIHINMGAYLSFSLALFVIWLVNFVFFDRQRYVAVTSGQVRLNTAIGQGETVFDTTGMVFQKQRSDLFRHWILGFGSGDLEIRPAGQKDPIDLPNVLFVGHKVQEIQGLIKEKQIVSG